MRGGDDRPIERGADERRRDRAAILAELDAQLEGSPASVVVFEPEGRITTWNGGAEELYGWSADEALGESIHELAVMPVDRLLAAEVLSCVLDAGRWEGFLNGRRRDGSAVLVHVRLTSVDDEHGEVVGFLGVSVPAARCGR